MYDRNVLSDIRQVQRFFDGCVATAYDDDVLPLVEKSVACRACRHAFAHERLLGRQSQIFGRRAGRDDQRIARVLAAVAAECERPRPQIDAMNVIEDRFGRESLGVLLKSHHQIGAHDAIRVGRPIIDVGRRHQLAPLRDAGDQHRLKIRTRGVDRSGVAGRT